MHTRPVAVRARPVCAIDRPANRVRYSALDTIHRPLPVVLTSEMSESNRSGGMATL
nr:hypothetical protein GCM10020063_084320 [Dactylosporangium thailandense]